MDTYTKYDEPFISQDEEEVDNLRESLWLRKESIATGGGIVVSSEAEIAADETFAGTGEADVAIIEE